MASITTIMRSGYYILRMLPQFVWLPVDMRTRLRRATDAFEDQLLQNGINPDVARELAETYHKANKNLVNQLTSPKTWTRIPAAR